jgi:hypothetical protein
MLSINSQPEWPDPDRSGDRTGEETRAARNLSPPGFGEGPEPDFLLSGDWDLPLWRSLLANIATAVAPEKLPPLRLESRPVNLGMPLGDRLRTPWYRTVFTNLGDVISPEVLPPLELESRPVDVGELVADQLSHLWFSSFLRNLADVVAPERQPPLELSSKPDESVLPAASMLLPRWSSVIDGPKIFLPDAPKPVYTAAPGRPAPAPASAPPGPPAVLLEFLRDMHGDLRRDLSRSRLRARIWMALAGAQVVFLIGSRLWHW